MSEDHSSGLAADSRDRLYAALAEAISEAGESRESLLLARLALLLFEAVGDEDACRRALADALHELPVPSLSVPSPADSSLSMPSPSMQRAPVRPA